MNQMVHFVQQHQQQRQPPSTTLLESEHKQNGRGLGRIQETAPNAVVLGVTNGAITLLIVLNHHGISRETPSDQRCGSSVGRGNRRDAKCIGE